MWLIVTVLPAPDGPRRTVMAPARHREVDPVEAALRPKALHDARELDGVPRLALT